MQPDSKNISDLDYLAELGFEQVPYSEADIDELRQNVQKRVLSSGGPFYFLYISLISGMFIGITVFFNYYNAPKIFSVPAVAQVQQDKNNKEEAVIISLDTLTIREERFVKDAVRPTVAQVKLDTLLLDNNKVVDSAVVMNRIRTDSIIEITLTEPENLKYAPNSPITYIYDYKISDYRQLYFKRNSAITLRENMGVPVLYASAEDMKSSLNLMEAGPSYFLHQALGDAMLAFKKRNYGRCLSLLNQIAGITDNDINTRFYSGMCYYYKKNYDKAIKQFDACIANANNSFLQEAEFYKAMSLYESGDKEQAKITFRKISGENGFYTAKAMEMLR